MANTAPAKPYIFKRHKESDMVNVPQGGRANFARGTLEPSPHHVTHYYETIPILGAFRGAGKGWTSSSELLFIVPQAAAINEICAT